MSTQDRRQGPTPDPMDELLAAAFQRALASPDNPSVVEDVMAGIARRERQRMLIVGLIGIVAAVLAAFLALPLIGLVASLLTDLADAVALSLPALTTGLPVLALLLTVGITAGWLFLEEAF